MLYGYARVSTDDQDTELQRLALRKAGCKPRDIFVDHGISGKFVSRPALDRCLRGLQHGDTLIVWKLDRLGRDMHDLLQKVKDLKERGVQFRSITESIIDTTSPQGELIFHVFAAFSQFERGLLLERTAAGRKHAKAKGKKFGPKFKLDADKKSTALRLLAAGDSCAKAAQIVGVSRSTLYRELGKLPPSLVNRKRKEIPVQDSTPPLELEIDYEEVARIEAEVFQQQRLELALIEAIDPQMVASLEAILARKQAEVVDDWIENNEAWNRFLPNFTGGRGAAEERRQAILEVIRKGVSPEELASVMITTAPRGSTVEILESGAVAVRPNLREFVPPELRPFLKPK